MPAPPSCSSTRPSWPHGQTWKLRTGHGGWPQQTSAALPSERFCRLLHVQLASLPPRKDTWNAEHSVTCCQVEGLGTPHCASLQIDGRILPLPASDPSQHYCRTSTEAWWGVCSQGDWEQTERGWLLSGPMRCRQLERLLQQHEQHQLSPGVAFVQTCPATLRFVRPVSSCGGWQAAGCGCPAESHNTLRLAQDFAATPNAASAAGAPQAHAFPRAIRSVARSNKLSTHHRSLGFDAKGLVPSVGRTQRVRLPVVPWTGQVAGGARGVEPVALKPPRLPGLAVGRSFMEGLPWSMAPRLEQGLGRTAEARYR